MLLSVREPHALTRQEPCSAQVRHPRPGELDGSVLKRLWFLVATPLCHHPEKSRRTPRGRSSHLGLPEEAASEMDTTLGLQTTQARAGLLLSPT